MKSPSESPIPATLEIRPEEVKKQAQSQIENVVEKGKVILGMITGPFQLAKAAGIDLGDAATAMKAGNPEEAGEKLGEGGVKGAVAIFSAVELARGVAGGPLGAEPTPGAGKAPPAAEPTPDPAAAGAPATPPPATPPPATPPPAAPPPAAPPPAPPPGPAPPPTGAGEPLLPHLTDEEVGSAVEDAEGGTKLELPGQNPETGEGLLNDVIKADPSKAIPHHENLTFKGIKNAPGGKVQVRRHSANPNAPPGSYSQSNPTTQVNSVNPKQYMLPDGTFKPLNAMTDAEKAAAHFK